MGAPHGKGKGKGKGTFVHGLDLESHLLKKRIVDKNIHIANLSYELGVLASEQLRREVDLNQNTAISLSALECARDLKLACETFKASYSAPK